MTASDKLALIDKIVTDAVEWFCVGNDVPDNPILGTLYAVQTVLIFDGRDDNESD